MGEEEEGGAGRGGRREGGGVPTLHLFRRPTCLTLAVWGALNKRHLLRQGKVSSRSKEGGLERGEGGSISFEVPFHF